MVGEFVTHVRFGRGRVEDFAPPRIVIAFEDGSVRTFAYPQSVERFLRFEGEDARRRAEADRARADVVARESALERIMEERRRAEEAARQRVEALREKRVEAARRSAARSAMARRSKAGDEEAR